MPAELILVVVESLSHATLKRLAREFLLRIGCCAAACEVLCPIARHRVDAAGYADDGVRLPPPGERAMATLWSLSAALRGAGQERDPAEAPALHPAPATIAGELSRRRRTRTPATVIIECKRSRQDFFRDGEDVEALLRTRDALRARRREIEETRVKRAEPHLRRSGSALFAELEEWDFAASQHPAYRRVLRELRQLDQRLYGHAKFSKLARYRLADHLLVLAPSALIRPTELPEGWGLVECPRQHLRRGTFAAPISLLDDLPLRLTVSPPQHATVAARRQRLLRNLAVRLTRATQE